MRAFGIAAMLGVVGFGATVLLLQAAASGTGTEWSRHYVSDFANGPGGALFAGAVLGHAAGNMLLGVGLRRSLGNGVLCTVATVLFLLATAGLAATGVFAADAPGAARSAAGLIHRTAASASFAIELAALVLFSAAFAAEPTRQGAAYVSFALTVLAAATSAMLLSAVLLGWRPGLAERAALTSFMSWEFWAGAWLALRAEPGFARRVERFSTGGSAS